MLGSLTRLLELFRVHDENIMDFEVPCFVSFGGILTLAISCLLMVPGEKPAQSGEIDPSVIHVLDLYFEENRGAFSKLLGTHNFGFAWRFELVPTTRLG